MKISRYSLFAAILCGGLNVPIFAQQNVVALSSQEVRNVNATADATVNAALPPAPVPFRLTGAINGTAAIFIAVTAQTSDGLSVFSGRVDPVAKSYLVLVPTGTYNLSVSYIGSLSGATGISTFKDPAPVQVNGDTVHDITVVPTVTHTVSGAISALDPRFSSTVLIFAPTDVTSVFAIAPAQLAADGTYSVQLSDGVYAALLALSNKDFSESTSTNIGSVTVAGADVSANFTEPAFANLSGTVQMADMSPVAKGSTVVAIEGNPLLAPTTSGFPLFSFGSGPIDNTSGSYQMVLASGRTYTLGVDLKLLAEDSPQSSGDFIFLVSSNVPLAGDTTQNIAVPQIPGTVTVSGQVTDPTGAPVANAAVVATTAQVTGISLLGSFSRGTQTDQNGNYRLVVLSGTNYDFTFSPPVTSASLQFQSNGNAGVPFDVRSFGANIARRLRVP